MQLSDSKTKRSFEKSSKAFDKSRFSASISDIDPHETSCVKVGKNQTKNSSASDFSNGSCFKF